MLVINIKRILVLILTCCLFENIKAQNIETIIQRSGGGKCQDFSISPDGLLLAKINDNIGSSEIEIWNTKTGHLLRVISTNSSVTGAYFFLNSVKHVRFWRGSKSIITGTFDGDHEIYDVATGKLIKKLKLKSGLEGVFAVSEKTGVFVALAPLSFGKNELLFCDLYSETVYDSVSLNIGKISALEFSPEGDKIVVGTESGSFHVIELATFNRTMRADSVHDGAINYLQWTDDNYLFVSDNTKFSIASFATNKIVSNGKLELGSRIISSPVEDCYYLAQEKNILKRAGNKTIQKIMGVDPDLVRQMEIDVPNNRLYILTDNFIRVWDLKNILQTENKKLELHIPDLLITDSKKKNTVPFRFIPSLRSFIYQQGNKLIKQSIDTTVAIQNFLLSTEKINSLVVTSDGSPVISINGAIKFPGKEKLTSLKTSGNDSILFVFPTTNKLAAVSSRDSVLKIYDIYDGSVQKITLSGDISCGVLSPDKKHFAVAGDKLYVIDAATLKAKLLYDPQKEDFVFGYDQAITKVQVPGSFRQLCFSKNGQLLFALNSFGQVKVWNLKTATLDTVLNINAVQVSLAIDDDKIFIARRNELILINTKDFKLEASFAFLAKGDFIVSLSDNFYRSSRNGAKAVAFRKGLQSFGFDQFDVIYNRPDIVAKRLGNPSAEMIELLQKTVIKRQKKSGSTILNETNFELDAPELTIKNYSKIPTATKEKNIQFEVSAKDKKYPLVSYTAFVNGVPFWSKNGDDITQKGTPEQRKSVNLSLTSSDLEPGKNLIEVSFKNDKGIESTRESFEIFYTADNSPKPTLYFIGIGAGNYQQSELNLKYPAKDIADVSKLFSGPNNLYAEVKVTLLKNEQVTKKGIAGLRKLLSSTNVRDQVIIYWSGHGVLSKELDYFLATYKMDFNNPEKEGLEYNELENLLDSIPARKRLLFIDACHSGELDKEDVILTSDTTRSVDEINSKGLRVKVTKSSNTSALLNEMFADTRRSSGANIISAAGGAEYALEGDKWSNGVFTFALLQGLSEKKADLNKDGEISISELQVYLQEKVPELTKGRQKPTSRTENLVKDWRIW